MGSAVDGQVEILVLGLPLLRRDGVETAVPAGKNSEALLALVTAPGDGWLYTREARVQGRVTENAVQKWVSLLRTLDVPIETGPRNTGSYRLDRARCRVDAWDFTAGVDGGADIDALTRMWRATPPPGVLGALLRGAVGAARQRLIERIAALDDAAQSRLADLDRFTALFPDDRAVDRIRRHGPGRRKKLLVVEDDPDMLEEIRGRLEPAYRCEPVRDIEQWEALRRRGGLDGIDGALVDLHLTPNRDDKRGQDVVSYLCEWTEIPVALVTANAPERSAYGSDKHRKEFRLVDIVDKQQSDWWGPLARAVRLLVSDGEEERRHRLETWLEHAFRTAQREYGNGPPGSVAAGHMHRCRTEYGDALRAIRVEPVEDATRAVDEFCRRWRVRH